ncbi:hypothetical protein BH24ACT5_BH24ACT5_03660 [soil metagenome]
MVSAGDTDRGRWDSFDGLRAVLVMTVMIHHAEALFKGWSRPVVEAGWLPVDGFFVLSGFLIVDVLLRRTDRDGTFDIRAFLLRRLARLYPALLVVLGAIAVVATTLDHRPWRGVWPSLVSAASYVHNFSNGRVSPLLTEVGPMWSLSVEFQFYVAIAIALGAVVLVASPPRSRARPLVVGTVFGIGLASAVGRARLGVQAFPRSYLTTPFRLDGLAAGVLLALAVRSGLVARTPRAAVTGAGIVALGALLAITFTMGVFDSITYTWGIAAGVVASTVVVAWLVRDPGSALARALSTPLLVALGRRSYAAYLWHQTVFLALFRHTDLGGWSVGITGFAITGVLADATYRVVERPVLSWTGRWATAPGRRRRPATGLLSREGPEPAA